MVSCWQPGRHRAAPFCLGADQRIIVSRRRYMKRAPWPRPFAGRALNPRAAFWCALSIWVLTLGVSTFTLAYTAINPLPARLVNLQGSTADGVAGIAFIGGFAT